MNEVSATVKNDLVQTVDMNTITEYLDSTGLTKKLLPNEKAMFVNIAQMYGLNPFKRELYCNVYGQGDKRQCSIITGYEVYLKRADRIGKLDGWETTLAGKVSDGTLSATVIIYRKDWSHPFKHTVYYREVVQTTREGKPNRFWQTQPTFMTRKVAVAQAFRLCFPDEFGGMPYTNDEMGVEESAPTVERNVTPKEEPIENEEPIVVDIENPKSESYTRLENVLNKYGEMLKKSAVAPTPYEQAKTALESGSDEQIEDKYVRCVMWLGKHGVNVEE